MLSKLKIGFIACLFLPAMTFAKTPEQNHGFAFSEHYAIGNHVNLRFADNQPGQTNAMLTLPNGLKLSYGDLISFGDLYGIIGQPISQGRTAAEKQTRVLTIFNLFAQNKNTVAESIALMDVVHFEAKTIDDAIANGEPIAKAHARISNEVGRRINCITGGGCSETTWWLTQGRLLKLMQDNYDHFRDNAVLAYQAGHEVALDMAVIAHANNDQTLLSNAYAINAFSCHFLSDRFAAGHIRTPRNELPAHTTPVLFGALLAGYMHSEEGNTGIHVHNLRGDRWVDYGDKQYFQKETTAQRVIIDEAMQMSADEIFTAYVTGTKPQKDLVLELIPIPDETNAQANVDLSPMFYWDAKTQKLLRREDLANVYDKHWTANWWGWSTLLALQNIYGSELFEQSQIVAAGYGQQAIDAGIIRDPRVVAEISKR